MYEETTYDVILERMLDRVSDRLDKRPSSVIYDTHSATAAELQILYIELEYLIKNSYGDTAAREFLILLAKDRGLAPEPATHAILRGEFTPAGIELTGQRFNIGDVNYVVQQKMNTDEIRTCDPDKSYYRVQCESTGETGNRYLGQMIPMDYIPGLETAALTEVLIPGEDEEDTEVFRQRYFDSFNEQTFGGNQADYLAKVRSIEGVGGVKVTRVWNGDIRPSDMIPGAAVRSWYGSVIGTLDAEVAAWLSAVYMASYEKKLTVGGTVLITVVNSLDYGETSTVLLDKIQTELDPEQNAGEGYGAAPIGHVVMVKSAFPVNVTVNTAITFEEGYGWSNLQSVINQTVSGYLQELRQKWADTSRTVIRISQIESRILAVKGVADITDTELNGAAGNLTLGEYEIPVLGGVSA